MENTKPYLALDIGVGSGRVFIGFISHDSFKIPADILPGIVPPGNISPEIQEYTGINSARVIAVAGHDTINASAAYFTRDPHTAFVSVGTWSILGILINHPETGNKAFQKGFFK